MTKINNMNLIFLLKKNSLFFVLSSKKKISQIKLFFFHFFQGKFFILMDYKESVQDVVPTPDKDIERNLSPEVDLTKIPHFGIYLNPLVFYEDVKNALVIWTEDEISKALINFKASLIQNYKNLPEDLFNLEVSSLLVSIKPPKFSLNSLYYSILCSCVWTAIQNRDLAPYFDPDYFHLIYEQCLEASAKTETKQMFAACLCLIKNITSESGDISLQFMQMHGLECFSLLYNETQSKDVQNTITQIVLNALEVEDIPLEYGHFAADMYLPTLRSSLENLTEKDIEVLHSFCLTGLDYAKYFMDYIGPQKMFQVYSTADVDVRVAILKFWKEMTECPDKEIAYSALCLPWESLTTTIEIDKDLSELQSISDLILQAFQFGEDTSQNIFQSSLLYRYLTIIERGRYDMRAVCLETMTLLVEMNSKSIISYIVTNGYIQNIISMLDVCDVSTLSFALRLLLTLISQPHPNNEYNAIVSQLHECDYEDIENELFDDDEYEVGAMYEVFLMHVQEFIDNCPPIEEEKHIQPNEDHQEEDEDEDDLVLDIPTPAPIIIPSQCEEEEDSGFEDVD